MRTVGPDSSVEVKFLDGAKLRGWISEVSDSGFSLSHEKKGQLEKSRVSFDQVRAVKQVKSVKPGWRSVPWRELVVCLPINDGRKSEYIVFELRGRGVPFSIRA